MHRIYSLHWYSSCAGHEHHHDLHAFMPQVLSFVFVTFFGRIHKKYVRRTPFSHRMFTHLLTKDLVHRETSGLDTLIQPVLSSSSLTSSVDSHGPITPETHPVHIDVEVPDIEGEGIGEVDVALVVKADKKPIQPAGLANSAGLQEKRVFFRRIVHKLVPPGNRPSTVLFLRLNHIYATN